MRAVAFGVVAVALVGWAGVAAGADDNKALIVGHWEIVYSDAKDIPVGTKVEFTAAGRMSLTVKTDGKEETRYAGGYKVEKDVFTLTGREGGKNDSARICLLNKTSFVLNDELGDKLMVLKRITKK